MYHHHSILQVDVKLGGGNQDCLVPLHITLIAPDDLHTLEIDEDFKVEDSGGIAICLKRVHHQ